MYFNCKSHGDGCVDAPDARRNEEDDENDNKSGHPIVLLMTDIYEKPPQICIPEIYFRFLWLYFTVFLFGKVM